MSGPPFEDYPVTPATIRSNADRIGNSAKPLVGVKEAMDGPRQKAADAVDGELDGKIEGPTEPAQQDAMETARGAELCSGAVELYAGHVELFNIGVKGLNERWAVEKEQDFGVPMGDDAVERDADVAEARSEVVRELRKEYARLESALDDGAADVARVLNAGPADGAKLLASYRAKTSIDIAISRMLSGPGGLTLDQILRDYQVGDDSMVWMPGVGVIPSSEAWMLGNLTVMSLIDMKGIRDQAYGEANDRFTPGDQNDNHNDAFRHAYWNALMARRFGEEWAKNYGNAHEGIPGNQEMREAMDLYNNEVGRRIAEQHPDAADEEVADLVEQAVRDGEMLVIDPDGELAWSNTLEDGEKTTGDPDEDVEGPEDGNPDNDPDSNANPESHNEHGSGS